MNFTFDGNISREVLENYLSRSVTAAGLYESKTLEDDLTAYKIMGEAAGILEYFAQQYVCNNLNLYAPPKNE